MPRYTYHRQGRVWLNISPCVIYDRGQEIARAPDPADAMRIVAALNATADHTAALRGAAETLRAIALRERNLSLAAVADAIEDVRAGSYAAACQALREAEALALAARPCDNARHSVLGDPA